MAFAKTVVGQDCVTNLNATVFNWGDYTEHFNITFYANTTIIGTVIDVVLLSGEPATKGFTWNTSGFAMGNCTISAVAEILPGETDAEDNTLSDGWVFITIPGDINGDKFVNAKDAVLLGAAFNSNQGQPSYDPNADINGDQWCNAKDAVILGTHFNEHW
jgi:hypothetical protein